MHSNYPRTTILTALVSKSVVSLSACFRYLSSLEEHPYFHQQPLSVMIACILSLTVKLLPDHYSACHAPHGLLTLLSIQIASQAALSLYWVSICQYLLTWSASYCLWPSLLELRSRPQMTSLATPFPVFSSAKQLPKTSSSTTFVP